jgi:hypothetical protein
MSAIFAPLKTTETCGTPEFSATFEIRKLCTAQRICAADILLYCHCDAMCTCDSIGALFACWKLSF